jgi:prevent-host-death family protein
METTAKKLRFNTKEVLESVERGAEITITFRGEPVAKLIPFKKKRRHKKTQDSLFGIWKDRDDMKDAKAYVRKLREGTRHDND